jgi:hypothetical protein
MKNKTGIGIMSPYLPPSANQRDKRTNNSE